MRCKLSSGHSRELFVSIAASTQKEARTNTPVPLTQHPTKYATKKGVRKVPARADGVTGPLQHLVPTVGNHAMRTPQGQHKVYCTNRYHIA